MKRAIILFLVFIFTQQAYPQDLKSTWSINAMMSHYERQKENELDLGKVGYNVNPGIEVLYNYRVQNSMFLSTGISYQYVSLVSHIESSDRFQAGEISIPALLTVKGKSNCLSFTAGIYGGQFVHFSWQQKNGSMWEDVNKNNRSAYSDNSFFMDGYLDLGYTCKGIKIAPFIRYRFKDNWMEYYRTHVYYGVKFGINSFKSQD